MCSIGHHFITLTSTSVCNTVGQRYCVNSSGDLFLVETAISTSNFVWHGRMHGRQNHVSGKLARWQ